MDLLQQIQYVILGLITHSATTQSLLPMRFNAQRWTVKFSRENEPCLTMNKRGIGRDSAMMGDDKTVA